MGSDFTIVVRGNLSENNWTMRSQFSKEPEDKIFWKCKQEIRSIRNQADIIMLTNQKREQEREKKEKEGKKNEKSIYYLRYLGLKHYIFSTIFPLRS